MPKTVLTWTWEEAFQKFGFNDGNNSQTFRVQKVLEAAGYGCDEASGGWHNNVICGLSKEMGAVWAEETCEDVDDDAKLRASLPPEVVALLDTAFPDDLVIEDD